MPKISRKGIKMPESPIRKLVPYAEKAKNKGKNVLHLNIGQPDLKPPDCVIEKLNNLELNKLEYSHSAGIIEYRKKLAKYYKEISQDITFNEILITTGGSEALNTIINCICDPGDEIIIPDPYYANYNGFINSCSATIKPLLCDIKKNSNYPRSKILKKILQKELEPFLICNPGNPTGALYSIKELKQLSNIVKHHDLFLIADEVYREFVYDNNVHHSVLTLKNIHQNTILIDSVSKRYSMCGARIGAIISKNKDVINTALKFSQARLSPPTIGQILSMEALDSGKKYFSEIISEYDKRRRTLVELINKIDGIICPLPKGAFYCIAELPVKNAENFCKWLLLERERY